MRLKKFEVEDIWSWRNLSSNMFWVMLIDVNNSTFDHCNNALSWLKSTYPIGRFAGQVGEAGVKTNSAQLKFGLGQ